MHRRSFFLSLSCALLLGAFGNGFASVALNPDAYTEPAAVAVIDTSQEAVRVEFQTMPVKLVNLKPDDIGGRARSATTRARQEVPRSVCA